LLAAARTRLPVDEASKIELINPKAPKALGIEIPTALLVRADEVDRVSLASAHSYCWICSRQLLARRDALLVRSTMSAIGAETGHAPLPHSDYLQRC
jgi:hypothetical protein